MTAKLYPRFHHRLTTVPAELRGRRINRLTLDGSNPDASPDPGEPCHGAFAVECIKAGGPFVFSDRYLVIEVIRRDGGNWFRLMVDGEQRTERDERFKPCRHANWTHFGAVHRNALAPESFAPGAARRAA